MTVSEPIRTLAGEATFELEEKRSRFFVRAVPVASPAEALARLEALSDPAATHNCWAYRIGEQYRFSDDGEPGGTAGRPILAAIESQGLDRVLVVVIRHFGGIKLGAGGLVRAYGGAAASCLRGGEQVELWPAVQLRVVVSFTDVSTLQALLARTPDLARLAEDYTADGATFTLRLQQRHRPDFERALSDATRGRALVTHR
jgi:putative IMPACT (imprinted ancient) family translation regulator